MIEVWKPIAGFEKYEVSTLGNVRRSVGGQGAVRGKIQRWHTSVSTGYPDVRLAIDGKSTSRCVHRLVAETFLGERPIGMQIRHLDGNKMNCRVDNLAYGTAAENAQDKIDHGRSTKGARNPKAKLDDVSVKEIRRLAAQGVKQIELAATFKIHHTQIARIVRREHWPHVCADMESSNRALDRGAR